MILIIKDNKSRVQSANYINTRQNEKGSFRTL